jgi:hypothetical protein
MGAVEVAARDQRVQPDWRRSGETEQRSTEPTAAEADDEPTAVAGVLETLHSGLGQDSALVRVIIEQMEALTDQR